MTANATSVPLPEATKERWSPLRLGLVELFHYDEQEFWFRDGRLLLRGNNGTGKSKVLALTLPLLLDADLSPHRVEPDGDANKKMEWNLLLDGAYEDRIGYTWLELGRRSPGSGDAEYLTLGIGLKAVRGRGVADRWFFLTPCRVGADLRLLTAGRTVLTRDRLEEALAGGRGEVLRTADRYRRAVDERLFHLGQERYDALMDLLVQLRQPQLSKRPDEARLSAALSQALPPVDQAILADVAAALHDLDQQGEELAALRDAQESVERFLARYRAYARVATRREARVVRSSQSETDEVGRRLGAVRARVAEHAGAEARQVGEQEQLALRIAELDATREELAGRPELKDLDLARRLRTTTAEAARRCREDVARAGRDITRVDSVLVESNRRTRTREGDLDAATARTAGHAAASGLTAAHEASLPAGTEFTPALLGRVQATLEAAAERRVAACAQVENLIRLAREAELAVVTERSRLAEREAELDRAHEGHAQARAALEEVRAATLGIWRGYVAGLTTFVPEHPDDAGLADWTHTLDGPNPAAAAVEAAARTAARDVAGRQARAEQDLGNARAELERLEAEHTETEAAAVLAPPPQPTRDAAGRAGRPGAALWQLVEFADGVPGEERAGLEAALEASGLLDAWVSPDGRLVDVTDDALAIAGFVDGLVAGFVDGSGGGEGGAAGPSLARVLRPAADVPEGSPPVDVVERLLRGLGLGAPDTSGSPDTLSPHTSRTPDTPHSSGASGFATWISPDGRFAVGALHGSWHKASAAYLGTAEREAARRRRLAELAAAIEAAQEVVGALLAQLADLAQRAAAIDAERAAMPDDTALHRAHAAGAHAAAQVVAAREALARQEASLAAAQQHLAAARAELDEAAADLALPASPEELRAVRDAVRDYREHLPALWRAAEALAEARADVAAAAEAAVQAREHEAELVDRDRAATAEAAAAAARLAALQDSVGGTVEQLQARLVQVMDQLSAARREHKGATAALEATRRQLHEATGEERTLLDQLTAEQRRRDEAVAAFQAFAATGLVAIAVPEVDLPDPIGAAWAADPTVRLARRVEQTLTDVDDGESAWRRVQDDVTRQYTELASALSRHGHTATSELVANRFVVKIVYQGRDRSPDELVDLLADEVDHRERLLSAKERVLLEEHLVNDVAGHLQQLITEAEAQVAAMNSELEERPTSIGMRLRLQWLVRPDGPEGLAEARGHLLRQTSHLWSPQDRTAVAEFLSRQIQRERAARETGAWHEHLAKALDYRAWHRFAIERYQDGRWRPGAGPASGGERVLTVSLPLFAAASAHYRSAHPHAPRLVMLDEAFAGVDDDARAKCLGLLATFDLDVVMTSEREWGFYSTVPGIATHQLVRREGVDAVHVSVWEWDGIQARQVDRPPAVHPSVHPVAEPGDAAGRAEVAGPDEVGLF